jgi:hypothetical protein
MKTPRSAPIDDKRTTRGGVWLGHLSRSGFQGSPSRHGDWSDRDQAAGQGGPVQRAQQIIIGCMRRWDGRAITIPLCYDNPSGPSAPLPQALPGCKALAVATSTPSPHRDSTCGTRSLPDRYKPAPSTRHHRPLFLLSPPLPSPSHPKPKSEIRKNAQLGQAEGATDVCDRPSAVGHPRCPAPPSIPSGSRPPLCLWLTHSLNRKA